LSALKNFRHESFCQLVASGESLTEAYVRAGFRKAGARQNSSRLMKRPDITLRIDALRPGYETKKQAAISAAVEAILTQEVMDAEGVVKALITRYRLLIQVIKERSEYDDRPPADEGKKLPQLPGVTTGLVVTGFKAVGGRAVRTHAVDIELLRELREIEKMILMARGLWMEKFDSTHRIESPAEIPTETLLAWRKELLAKEEEEVN
jgi:hypothetical protein